MRPLIIDENAKKEIARVCEYAESHRISRRELNARMAFPIVSVGNNPNTCCHLEHGFKCVLSIEEQPIGWCKHLSISVDRPGKFPHPQAVDMLMQEFGMNRPLEQCHVYIEENSNPKSINIICPI